MKRLNRKGFTLVELLAVIVILAIVVGITLVTVLPTLKKSRQEAFELTAQTAADYLEKQYQLYLVGEMDNITEELKNVFQSIFQNYPRDITKESIIAAGLKPENYVAGTWYVNKTTGRACVRLYASTNTSVNKDILNLSKKNEAGEYYDATEITYTDQLMVYTSSSVDSKVGKIYKFSVAESSACP